MSEPNPWSFLFSLGDPEQRGVLAAFGGLGAALALAHGAGPGPVQSGLAVVLLVLAPLLALRLSGRPGLLFLLIASVGARAVFGSGYDGAAPVILVARLAYFATPALLVSLILTDRDRARLKIEPFHLSAPALVACAGVVVHLALRWGAGFEASDSEIRLAALIYGACYLILLIVGLLSRIGRPPERAQLAATVERAIELEEQGRFDMAARAYERDGQLDKAARAAERAGDWPRAARLYRAVSELFTAGEMYYRSQMWQEALECYERAEAFPAAARLCVQRGEIDRAAALYERAGDRAAALGVLKEAGRAPTGDQYHRAGLMAEAAAAFEQAGEWLRAAEVCEHDLDDRERAAALHAKAGSLLHAGRLLESMGQSDRAADAYASIPAGAVHAARLHLAAGRAQKAAELLAKLPADELDKLEDEATLTVVSRVMLEGGRTDDAARLLQRLKRRGPSSGTVHLLLGRAFLEKGLPDLAEEELRVATSLPLEGDDETRAAYLLGCVLEKGGRHDEARQIFRDILQKNLNYADVEERYRRLNAPAKAAEQTS